MTMRNIFGSIFIILSFTTVSCVDHSLNDRFAGWDAVHMQHVRKELKRQSSLYQSAYEKLISDAEDALGKGPFSVTFKTFIPPGGTKNDYMSQGPYWWPDTTKPDGLPYIRKDGVSNPESRMDREQLGNLVTTTRILSLAWFFTGEEKYAARAAFLLKTWFIDPETKMNPHLEYGQAIPGRTAGRGIGIIDVRSLYTLVDAITLVETSGELSAGEINIIKAWFGDFFTWLTTSSHGKDEDDYHNNHSVAYDVIVTSIARYLGNNDYVARKISEMPARRIDPMIEADGRQPEELIRTNAFGYSVGNLRNFFDAGEIGLKVGVNIFSYTNPEGGSLRRALDFLAGFIDREEEWEWQQIGGFAGSMNNMALLLRRAARYYDEPAYRQLWEEKFAEKMKTEWSMLVTPGF